MPILERAHRKHLEKRRPIKKRRKKERKESDWINILSHLQRTDQIFFSLPVESVSLRLPNRVRNNIRHPATKQFLIGARQDGW